MLEEFLLNPYLIRAIIAILLIAIIAATIGTMINYRGETFLLVGSAHAAMAGAAFIMVISAYLGVLVNPLFGAGIFSIILVIPYFIERGKKSKEELESFLGLIFAFTLALAVFFISLLREYATQAWGLIIGDILLLTDRDILLLTAISMISLFIVLVFIRELLYVSFDLEGSTIISDKAKVYEMLFGIALSLGVIVLLKSVGALLIYIFTIAPASVISRVTKNIYLSMVVTFILASAIGLISLIIGVIFSISPSTTAGAILALIYLIVSVVKRE